MSKKRTSAVPWVKYLYIIERKKVLVFHPVQLNSYIRCTDNILTINYQIRLIIFNFKNKQQSSGRGVLQMISSWIRQSGNKSRWQEKTVLDSKRIPHCYSFLPNPSGVRVSYYSEARHKYWATRTLWGQNSCLSLEGIW